MLHRFAVRLSAVILALFFPVLANAAELLTSAEQDFENDPAPGRWEVFTWGSTETSGNFPGLIRGGSEFVSGEPVEVGTASGAPAGWGTNSLRITNDGPIETALNSHVGGVRITVLVNPGDSYTITGHLLFADDNGPWDYGAGMSIDVNGGTDPRQVTYGYKDAYRILAPDRGQVVGDCSWNQETDYNNEGQWFTPQQFRKTVTAQTTSLTVYLWALAKFEGRTGVQFDGISIEGTAFSGPTPTPTPTPSPTPTPRPGELTISSITQSAQTVGLYEPFFVQFNLGATYSNPFDPREIDAKLEFTGPSGKTRFIPAFWKGGSPAWEARIAPLEIGPHQCRIVAADNQSRSGAATLSFEAVPSGKRGFIRRDTRNSFYLRFDNGDPYFPIGYNMCWNHDNSNYVNWMEDGAANGINWSRIWMVPYVGMGIEWGGDIEPSYRGLGTYSPAESALYDSTLDRARNLGIYYQMCMDSFNGWNKNVFANWGSSPYNAANGGPLSLPIEYLTNPEAKRLAKQRFRYIVSRWGYETSVLCWEFFNEVDAMGSGDDWSQTYHTHRSEGAAWHKEMALYMDSIDPFDHLYSTSFAHASETWSEIWDLPEIDIVNLHRYSADIPDSHYSNVVYSRRYNKPIIFGEANADGGGMSKSSATEVDPINLATDGNALKPSEAESSDPNGGTLHRQIWALAAGESGAMSWWWDSWIADNDLFYQFKPLAAFLDGEDWAPYKLSPVSPVILSSHAFASTHMFTSAGKRGGMIFVYDSSGNSTTSGLSIRIPDVTAPNVVVEYWNTTTGTVISSEIVQTDSNGVVLNFPDFNWDAAAKFKAIMTNSHWMAW